MTEQYIVTIATRHGKRDAKRLPLNVPLDLATGKLERLSDLAIRETLKDLAAEQNRRSEGAAVASPETVEPQPAKYDPMQSQIRGGSR